MFPAYKYCSALIPPSGIFFAFFFLHFYWSEYIGYLQVLTWCFFLAFFLYIFSPLNNSLPLKEKYLLLFRCFILFAAGCRASKTTTLPLSSHTCFKLQLSCQLHHSADAGKKAQMKGEESSTGAYNFPEQPVLPQDRSLKTTGNLKNYQMLSKD